MHLNTVEILGVTINSTRSSEVLDCLVDFVAKPRPKTPFLVFTPNPEFLVEAARDDRFCELLNKADISLPDGIGLVWASRILKKPIRERVSGADVVEKLLEMGNESRNEGERWVVGISGARRGVQREAKELIKRLGARYPNIMFVNLDDPDCQFLISNSKTNLNDQNSKEASKFAICHLPFAIILACHGMKKQEEWIWENKDKIKAGIFMGVGGSLDFVTGFSRRSPLWIRQIGLEWLWRGVQRPRHWKRIWKATVEFGWLVVKEYVSSKCKVQSAKL